MRWHGGSPRRSRRGGRSGGEPALRRDRRRSAIAWEPADTRPGMSGLSFGQHRAIAMAIGLSGEANIDPAAPARNLDSPDSPGLGGTHRKEGGTHEYAGTHLRL